MCLSLFLLVSPSPKNRASLRFQQQRSLQWGAPSFSPVLVGACLRWSPYLLSDSWRKRTYHRHWWGRSEVNAWTKGQRSEVKRLTLKIWFWLFLLQLLCQRSLPEAATLYLLQPERAENGRQCFFKLTVSCITTWMGCLRQLVCLHWLQWQLRLARSDSNLQLHF